MEGSSWASPGRLTLTRVRFLPNARPLIVRHTAQDFDLLRLDEQRLHVLAIVGVVVLFRLDLLPVDSVHVFCIRISNSSLCGLPPCEEDMNVERRNGINYFTYIHHVIQGGVPILHKLEHARVVPILVDLTEDVQRLRFDVAEGGFEGLEEGFGIRGVDGDLDVDGETGVGVRHFDSATIHVAKRHDNFNFRSEILFELRDSGCCCFFNFTYVQE